MQILHIEMPPEQHTERGLKIGLFGCATGSAYLASLPDDEIGRLAISARVEPAAVPRLLKEADRVRKNGYAYGPGPDETVWTIAMALPMRNSPVPLFLGVAGKRSVLEERSAQLRAMMLEAVNHWLTPTGGEA
jgi:DNA-binding IclR family transcriptional regulator